MFGTAGFPTKGFFADNGKEYVNEAIRALCRRMNLSIKYTPAYSPWSNGGNERRHASVDATIVKMLEDSPTTTLEEALNHACYCRNEEISSKGYAPRQLFLPSASAIPGITDGNVAKDSMISDSKAVHEQFKKHQMAKDAFRKADSDDRIKRGLKSKGYKYHDEIYEPGEKLWFMKNNAWDEGTVTGMDGRTVIFDCKNQYGLKRPTCYVKKSKTKHCYKRRY